MGKRMNHGEWQAILQFLEAKNDSGRECICRCSQCTGTYVKHRAYLNDEGDFVLSEDTLMKLLSDFKYTSMFDNKGSPEKNGYWFQKYWSNVSTDLTKEEERVKNALIRKEYNEEEN